MKVNKVLDCRRGPVMEMGLSMSHLNGDGQTFPESALGVDRMLGPDRRVSGQCLVIV